MLKIKDDVDLKELEKFEFKTIKKNDAEYYRYKLKTSSNDAFVAIMPITREIKIYTGATYILELQILYDLITAGLVEKVEKN